MNTKLFIITGVNGIGKSTIIPELSSRLDETQYIIHDFDERGVPDNAGANWRETEMVHWFNEARKNNSADIATIVCGFVKTSDTDFAKNQVPDVTFEVCLLDADAKTIETRIMSRYQTPESLEELERTTGKTPEKFVQDNIWVSGKFRGEAKEKDFYIFDTTNKNTKEVSCDAIEWIKKYSHTDKYKSRKYSIENYDPNWAKQYLDESAKLTNALGDQIDSVEHVGSTSVPNLAGKPTIDILVTLENIETADTFQGTLTTLGYKFLGQYVMEGSRLYVKEDNGVRHINLHFFQKDHTHIAEMMNLRNYLRDNPNLINEYSNLKLELFRKFPDDYGSYRKHKDEWMSKLMKNIK